MTSINVLTRQEPSTHLKKVITLFEMGAAPVVITRTFPPSIICKILTVRNLSDQPTTEQQTNKQQQQ